MTTNESLRKKRDDANKIVSEIEESFKEIASNLKKSKNILSNHEDASAETKKINASLMRLNRTAGNVIEKFREEKDTLAKLLSQANSFYNKKFIPLSEKIDSPETGLKARLKQGTAFKNDSEKILAQARTQFDEVKKYADELRKRNRELNSIERSINRIYKNSEAKNNRINDISQSTATIKDRVINISKTLEKLETESSQNSQAISLLVDKSQKEYDGIAEIKGNSEKILHDIQSIYDIAAETGLSGEFEKRRNQLSISLNKWARRIFWTSLVLLIIVIGMFIVQLWLYEWDLMSNTFNVNFYVRFLLASPIVYYLYFCSKQYSDIKSLYDKYSFKTTLAMSIKHHIQLLTENEDFKQEERLNRILDFILKGMERIYNEPHSMDDYKVKLKLINMEMNIEKRIAKALAQTNSSKGR